MEFTTLSLYFLRKNNAKQLIYTFLTCKIHFVEDLRANLLISNNIMSPEGFIIDVKGKNTLIGSCGVIVPIEAKQKRQFLTKKLLIS